MANAVVQQQRRQPSVSMWDGVVKVFNQLTQDISVDISIKNTKGKPSVKIKVTSSNDTPEGDFTVGTDGVIRY